MTFRTFRPLFALFPLLLLVLWAQPEIESVPGSVQMVLDSLDSQQEETATFDFDSEERKNWHFVPRPRQGLSLGSMTPAQRKLAHRLLSTVLSYQGLQKAEAIMFLESILYEMEGQNPIRDADAYFLSVFGTPGADLWGWRFEGHHLSLNFTLEGSRVLSSTPSFFGANPGKVPEGAHEGLRVLADEEDLARSLLVGLDGELRDRVMMASRAPRDILTGADREITLGDPKGVAGESLSSQQKVLLSKLLRVYVEKLLPEATEQISIQALEEERFQDVYFAWAGSAEPGEPHYYRIQGPDFLIEYDNTQNEANHIHSVWRDLDDFGERDPLREHYERAHSEGSDVGHHHGPGDRVESPLRTSSAP